MEDKDKAMEEFFRNSMDQFDEEPSSDVWSGIETQLDNESTWWQNLWRSSKAILPYLLIFFMFGSYFLYANNKIATLEKNLSLIDETAINKESDVALLDKLSTYEEEIVKLGKVIIDKELLIAVTQDELSRKEFNRPIATYETSGIINSKTKNLQNEINALLLQVNMLKSKLNVANVAIDNCKGYVEEAIINEGRALYLGNNELHKLPTGLLRQISRNSYIKPKFYIPLKQYILRNTDEHEELSKINNSPYRFGLTAGMFNTFVAQSDRYNVGTKLGLKQEFRILNKLSLTNTLGLNTQNYTIISDRNVIDNQILVRYPVNIDDSAQIERIEIKNRYIDLGIGLKYNVGNSKKGTSYYVNPSVKWLLYLPQEFEYTLSHASDLVNTENRYFLYFGSINLEFGVESRISDKHLVQLSIWAEQSMIPLGQEGQYIGMVGLQGAYLFGN